MTSFSNISLYIKRAELFHTEEYITSVLDAQQYGKVRSVRFIKKNSGIGKEYHGAVIIFERWFMNSKVKTLLDQLNSSQDRTAKIVHDHYNQRYWIVNEYKAQFREFEELITIDQKLPEKDRIQELENLVKSMAAQMHFMQIKQESHEKKVMEYEERETQAWLYNMELKSQLVQKEVDPDLKKEKINIDIFKLSNEVSSLTIKLIQKQAECEALKEEIYEEQSILAYVQSQANEMREMLKISSSYEPSRDTKGKMTIEELLD